MSRREELVRVFREHANIGYVPCAFTDADLVLKPKCINERPEMQDGYDWFGVHWTYQPGVDMMVTPGSKPLISDVTKWREQVTFPDLTQYDWPSIAAEETKNWDRENKYSVVMIKNGCFERTHHLMGFEEVLMALLEEPEAYKELLNAICDYKVELIKIIGTYYKPDVIMMHDDYGANDRMMMSLDTWREFFKEPLSRLVATAHEYGMVYEHHSCGHIEPIISDLIEIGVDAINPLQRPCNDIEKIKKLYGGKITLIGGFSSQAVIEHPNSTEEDILADIENAYNVLAPGGGYVSFPIIIDYKKNIPYFIRVHKKMANQFANT